MFCGLEVLSYLGVSSNKIRDIEAGMFSKVTSLVLLDLESNTLEFSLNGSKLSLNSVNSGNSENLRNH